jgi:hypothetical protein
MKKSEYDITAAEVELGYERNDIQLKGIVYFAGGLALLVVITFGLMFVFLRVLEDEAEGRLAVRNPMIETGTDRLPPEPRLQGAPGFGVASDHGPVNLELGAPQSEYWELRKQWDELLANGKKHPETGTVIAMPIEEAKARFLEQNIRAKTGPEAERFAAESLRYYTDASSGRVAGERRR